MSNISNIEQETNRNQSIFKTKEKILSKILLESGLDELDCPDWYFVNAIELNKMMRLREQKVHSSAIMIPYTDMNGEPVLDTGVPFFRAKLITAKNGMRYMSPAGSKNHLYIPNCFKKAFENCDILVITEGEKKAAKAVKHGIAAVGLAGVDMWFESFARDKAKIEAEELGLDAPKLTTETEIMRELLDLIDKIKPTKIVVLFDSDGALVSKADIKIGSDIDSRFSELNGKYTLNKNVHFASLKLAAALRAQTDIPIASGFIPFKPVPAVKMSTTGRQVEYVKLEKRGLDDYLMGEPTSVVQAYIEQLSNIAKKSGNKHQALGKADKKKPTYVALGYSRSETGQISYFWSHLTGQVCSLNESQMQRRASLVSVLGANYMQNRWTIEMEDEKGRKKTFFELSAVADDLISEAQKAGVWHKGRTRGAGVWADKDGLIVNCQNGVFKISADGTHSEIERCEAGRKELYVTTEKGLFAEQEATAAEVKSVLDTIDSGWRWRRDSDGVLACGWVLLQAYVAALEARPHLYVSGESGCGKSYFEEYVKSLLGSWGIQISQGRESSPAGVRQAIASDAITVMLDEMEPKNSGSEIENSKLNQTIKAILQMLRGAYSKNGDDYGAVKGSPGGEARDYEIRTSAMIAGIAPSEFEQADRNRFLRVEMRKLSRSEDGRLVSKKPQKLDPEMGAKIFRRMWSRWTVFKSNLAEISQKIRHEEERMNITLASPLAAVITALDLDLSSAAAQTLIDTVRADYVGEYCVDIAPPDHEVALNRLLNTLIPIGYSGNRLTVWVCLVKAIAAGLGKRVPNAGGEWGMALKAVGLTGQEGAQANLLFVSYDNPELKRLTAHLGFPALAITLRRVPGAIATDRENRAKICGSKVSGVWVPVPLVDSDDDISAQKVDDRVPF